MIRSFGSKETEKLFGRGLSRLIPRNIQPAALRKLRMLDAAGKLDDLRIPPANRLEKLRGEWDGMYSIRVNDQWRICFVWKEGHAYDVEIVDYH